MNELERMISPQLRLAGDEKAVVTEDQEVGYTTRSPSQTLFPYQKQESDKVVR